MVRVWNGVPLLCLLMPALEMVEDAFPKDENSTKTR